MTSIHVFGVPSQMKLSKILFIFKTVLRKNGVCNKFWINEMEDIRGTYLKSLKMEFSSHNDAYEAAKVLDGYDLAEADDPLIARIDDVVTRRRSPSPRRHHSRERYRDDFYERRDYGHGGYERERSRSPIGREASELDMEIELLRKQRMIIEEERRLIMERKKLELVKEFGPSAIREFRSLDEDRDRRYRPARSPDYRPRRASPPRRSQRPESYPSRPARNRPPHKKLPQFVLPCKILTRQMKELMDKHETGLDMSLLMKLMKNTLRKRIAVALEGHPILPASRIVEVYRGKYPQSMDEDFVLLHVKELKSLHMPRKGGDTAKETSGSSKEIKNEEGKTSNGKQETDSSATADTNDVTMEAKDASDSTLILEPQSDGEKGEAGEEEGEADQELDKREEGSVGSSDALALHDKNDEDWVQGEQGWNSDSVQ